jgi:hemerythrin-like metal-binding protein
MSFIEFTNNELVGVPTIDEQHREMVAIVNELYENIFTCEKEKILNYLNKLLKSLELHFKTEEKFMKSTRFTGYISHKLEHDRFYKQILTSTDAFSKGLDPFGIEQLKSIKRWFFNHIEISDKKCGKFLAENGIL